MSGRFLCVSEPTHPRTPLRACQRWVATRRSRGGASPSRGTAITGACGATAAVATEGVPPHLCAITFDGAAVRDLFAALPAVVIIASIRPAAAAAAWSPTTLLPSPFSRLLVRRPRWGICAGSWSSLVRLRVRAGVRGDLPISPTCV